MVFQNWSADCFDDDFILQKVALLKQINTFYNILALLNSERQMLKMDKAARTENRLENGNAKGEHGPIRNDTEKGPAQYRVSKQKMESGGWRKKKGEKKQPFQGLVEESCSW